MSPDSNLLTIDAVWRYVRQRPVVGALQRYVRLTACPFRRRSPSTPARRLAAEPVPGFTPESREEQKRPTSRPKRSHFVATGRRARFEGGRRRLRRVGSQRRLSQDCLEELKLLVLGVAANYSGVLRRPAKAPRLSAGPPPSVARWLWYSALPYRRATRLDGERTHAQLLGERASTRDRGSSRPSVPHHGPNHRRGASAGLQLPVEAHEMSASGGANLPNAVFVNIFRATAATARRVVALGGRVGPLRVAARQLFKSNAVWQSVPGAPASAAQRQSASNAVDLMYVRYSRPQTPPPRFVCGWLLLQCLLGMPRDA